MKSMRGFAIASAIFILVVLAVLGAAVLNVTSTQQIGSALDIQGVRAYQAARAGIEWGLYRQMQNGTCPGTPTSFTPTGAAFGGFTVTVICQPFNDANGGPAVHELTATACSQANAAEPQCPNTTNAGSLYVERRLSVTF